VRRFQSPHPSVSSRRIYPSRADWLPPPSHPWHYRLASASSRVTSKVSVLVWRLHVSIIAFQAWPAGFLEARPAAPTGRPLIFNEALGEAFRHGFRPGACRGRGLSKRAVSLNILFASRPSICIHGGRSRTAYHRARPSSRLGRPATTSPPEESARAAGTLVLSARLIVLSITISPPFTSPPAPLHLTHPCASLSVLSFAPPVVTVLLVPPRPPLCPPVPSVSCPAVVLPRFRLFVDCNAPRFKRRSVELQLARSPRRWGRRDASAGHLSRGGRRRSSLPVASERAVALLGPRGAARNDDRHPPLT
jgi:hypothetical protein